MWIYSPVELNALEPANTKDKDKEKQPSDTEEKENSAEVAADNQTTLTTDTPEFSFDYQDLSAHHEVFNVLSYFDTIYLHL